MESHGAEERIYVLHDANYNVTALVDASGNVLERYYYEAYGRAVYLDDAFTLQPDGQSDHGWQRLHQGGRLDSATGNYHFRHRDLSQFLCIGSSEFFWYPSLPNYSLRFFGST